MSRGGKKNEEKLTAKIAELTSDIEVADSKIEELSAAISTNDAELKEATGIRDKEHADFAASEKELVETVDTLDRAVSIISTEMAKNPALVQVDTSSAKKLIQSMGAIIDAAGFSGTDQKKLVALVQSRQQDKDGDEDKAEADQIV